MTLGRYRVVVTDVDGTLVDDRQNISDANLEAIRKFQERGGLVTLATGRVEDSARPFVRALGIKIPVILYNGAKIFDFKSETCRFESRLEPFVAETVLAAVRSFGLDAVFYADGAAGVLKRSAVIEAYERKDGIRCRELGPDAERFVRRSVKILVIDETGGFSTIEDALQDVREHCSIVRSEPTYLEVLPKGVSKGNALIKLSEMLGVPLQAVIAVGDQLNDLDMIRLAGLGVAVGNAHQEVKRAADVVVRSHLEDAIADIIERYALGGEDFGV
ncbi:MAG: hypothetical protein BLM47_05925 [Candidatus Reconcilbacillus cellulovorans]|uniref:Hydrolase Cof n=1 Tax=Candidatus Reconcilbacillus cellulovorans TaxID=1906605 RepID=A0A2A6E0X3_9BACL|nr:MAG: hypothetical protein BLM47_05925 [Candidatus Reconcilbacillus cellulovorans]